MRGIDKNVNIYLEEVGVDSDEHKKYLEKLNRVLEEMRSSSNSAERKHYVSFKETLDSFDRYLSEKKIRLSEREKDRFAVIVASGLNNLAKKRMAEDLIHQVKDRISMEVEQKAELAKRKDDIAGLKKTGFWLTDWYRLTKFALDYGTITPFTHRYRAEAFDLIRLKAGAAHKKIAAELKGILDGYYYYLSVLEYNSIVKFYEMKNSFEKLALVKDNPSYHPIELFEVMNDFAISYIAVTRNVKSIDNGLRKVFKDSQPGHGFMGYVGFITDRQIFNSRIVKHSPKDLIKVTLSGSLYSYYTAYLGVRVSTMNQLMYIVSFDGDINSTEKEYTPEAKSAIDNESNEKVTEGSIIKTKLSELVNITGKYSEMGRALSKRLFEIEARGSLAAWNKDAQIKPFFRLMKIFDAYLKHILELIVNHEHLELEYDNNIITGYFNKFTELVRAAEECRDFSLELQRARGKDLQNFKLSEEVDKEEFIKTLMEHENIATLPGEMRQLKETLGIISARCYNICMRCNDLLNKFFQMSKIESGEITENYNFLLNAKVLHPKSRNLEFVLNRKEVFLVDLLEASCSVAEYFSETLSNPGTKAVFEEVLKLQKELETHNILHESRMNASDTGDIEIADEGSKSEIDAIYIDSLTGFRKWEYFEDFILLESYDEDGNYKGPDIRQVFCAELSNLVDVNRECGNDTGDRVYKKFSEILSATLRSTRNNSIVLRNQGGLLVGYISGITAVESIDLLFKTLYLIKEYSLNSGIPQLPDLIFNAGLYTEKKGTNAMKNIEIARSIMFQGSDGKAGHVAFLKNSDLTVSDKDFDRRGRLRDGLISILN